MQDGKRGRIPERGTHTFFDEISDRELRMGGLSLFEQYILRDVYVALRWSSRKIYFALLAACFYWALVRKFR